MNHGTTRDDDFVTYEFLVWRHASVSFANTARLFPRASVGIKGEPPVTNYFRPVVSAHRKRAMRERSTVIRSGPKAFTSRNRKHRYQLGRVSGFPWFRAARSLKRRGNNTI